MPTYRFDLNTEYGRKLELLAEGNMMSVQDYIRSKLFPSETIFTVQEVIRRVRLKEPTDEFTIPDLYSDDEWGTINKSVAGVLGKNFFKFINAHPELGITLIENRKSNRRTVYSYTNEAKNE